MAAGWPPAIGLLLLLALLLPATASSMVLPLGGNVYPVGQFYVAVGIGEPAKPYFLHIDTGSTLTWVECDADGASCNKCNTVPHPLYRATKNKHVSCADARCASLHKDVGKPKNCGAAPQTCSYEIKFLEGSSSRGMLVHDKFSLLPKSNAYADIAFGCGYEQVEASGKNEKVPVDGVLGLGRGSVDLMSQLKQLKVIEKNTIGHCLSYKGGGFLVIGKDMSTLPVKKWVPMAPGQPRYYSPGRATLHLDTKSVGGADPVEVILDSGSTYTYLPSALHKQLVSELQATLGKSLQVVKDPSLPLCWKRPEKFKSVDDLKKEFKAVMSFNFGNEVTMVIPPENYLVVTQQGNACFGILDHKAKYIILGDITMQGLLVVYDNDRKQLAWVRADCNKPPKSISAIISRI
ncbi:hypothetical protein U9M48_004712 [Paspalum notatum var. saurae]|uniref:Peptidase A1 domain-containing protein n=1 Tax=Paspalum notatum var. saurae TaxID=547442 RepID=A0AAQ3SJA6_PASNO